MGLFENQKAIENKQGKRLTQAILADDLGYATQSAVSQYLKGKVPLNVEASVKFAARFGCKVSAFSPSIQEEIDRIASFATSAGDNAMTADGRKIATPKPPKIPDVPSGPQSSNGLSRVESLYMQAQPDTKAAVDVLLLPSGEREGLDGAVRGAILTIESLAVSALVERKKTKDGTAP